MFTFRRVSEHLLANALDRNGQAPALQAQALAEGNALSQGIAAPEARRARYAKTAGDLVQEALAQKVLGSWIQNRHQTLYPLAMNFRTLDAGDRLLLLQAIATALRAGESPPDRIGHVQAWLNSVGGTADDAAALERAAATPRSLDDLIDAARIAGQGPLCFAVSLVALSQASMVNRLYLDYLAAKLAISGDVARSLAQRYRL